MVKITKEQIKILKENIDKMDKSNEQFIFMLFKNPDGENNITEHSHNIIAKELGFYLGKAPKSGKLRQEEKDR